MSQPDFPDNWDQMTVDQRGQWIGERYSETFEWVRRQPGVSWCFVSVPIEVLEDLINKP